jgi:broad specificity phosphatase PhoE
MPSVTLELTAARHGESTLNAARLLTGQLDPPLTALGSEQARALATSLRPPYDAVVHSGARRARATLAIAAAAAGIEVAGARREPRFLERAFGDHEGMPVESWQQPRGDVDAAPPGGGESWRALGLRVHEALTGLPAGRVLLVAHSGVLRILHGIAVGARSLEQLFELHPQPGRAMTFSYAAGTELPPFLASRASGGRSARTTSRTSPPAQGSTSPAGVAASATRTRDSTAASTANAIAPSSRSV